VVAVTRRALLGAGAVAALGTAGCGVSRDRPAPPADADVLAGLLAVERELVTAWRAAAALAGAEGATARAVLAHERTHVRRLEAALAGRSAAGAPVPSDVTRAARELRTQAGAGDGPAALDAALALERAAAAAHIAALGRLRDPEARTLVMGLSGAEAQHAAAVALTLGREPLPDAFAGTLSA
jgi:hypothetical protein